MLFAQFYSKENILETSFLNLAQAAETFHARLNEKRERIPKAEFKIRKEKMLGALLTGEHEWLNSQLNNHLHLDTRLTELVENYSNPYLNKFIGESTLFVRQVKLSRNYYTHYSPEGQKKALVGAELIELLEKLQILLISAFLIEIGFDRLKLEEMFENKASRVFNI